MREIKPSRTFNDILPAKNRARQLIKNPKIKPTVAKQPEVKPAAVQLPRKITKPTTKPAIDKQAKSSVKPVVQATSRLAPAAKAMAAPYKVLARKVDKKQSKLTANVDDDMSKAVLKRVNLDLGDLPGADDLIIDSKAAKLAAKRAKKSSRKRTWIKRLTALVVIVFLALGGVLAYKVIIASNNSLKGGLGGFFRQDELKTDANGRTNFLLFGTSEDDPGHGGADLADSIMIVSVDHENQDLAMVSLPRDLWVKLPEPCTFGYQARINTVFVCGMGENRDQERGSMQMIEVAEETTGIDIQYYAKVNYTAVKQLVDAIGGVEVNVESEDARGIYDINLNLRLASGLNQLNGQKALDLMRARNSDGGYGLSRSNFDREQNQQRVLEAVLRKTLDAGILTNYTKLIGVVDALGDNVKTNFQTSEVRSLVAMAQKVDLANLSSSRIDLEAQDRPLLGIGNINGNSVVLPTAGRFDYSQIKQFLSRKLNQQPFTQEKAKIGVFNASGVEGVAGQLAEKLTAAGFEVVKTDNAQGQPAMTGTVIYGLTNSKPLTLAKLKQEVGGNQVNGSPAVDTTGLDFAVIIGSQ